MRKYKSEMKDVDKNEERRVRMYQDTRDAQLDALKEMYNSRVAHVRQLVLKRNTLIPAHSQLAFLAIAYRRYHSTVPIRQLSSLGFTCLYYCQVVPSICP
ncbi:MAG: hypothetical protein LBI74_05795 [Synergistaceae bacterium]|nr:hypothetical protein [Synergistaceae bacterium]